MIYYKHFKSKYQNFTASGCTYYRFITYMLDNLRRLRNKKN